VDLMEEAMEVQVLVVVAELLIFV
jgi:hypothetical protein